MHKKSCQLLSVFPRSHLFLLLSSITRTTQSITTLTDLFSLIFGKKMSATATKTQQKQPPKQETANAEGIKVVEKRKPVFIKVNQLRPGTSGHNIIVKVLKSDSVLPKNRPAPATAAAPNLRPTRIAECLIGDDTATILFTARNDQVDLMKEGTTVIIRNAKIDMFKGNMRLAVDKWGRIEVTEPANFVVKEGNDLSLIEYELVKLVEE